MKKIKYYVVSVTGYETYEPIWFAATCSSKEFSKSLSNAIDLASIKLTKRNTYSIGGSDLLKEVCLILRKNGYTKISANKEFDIRGECTYIEEFEEKPEIISEVTWKRITEYNEKVRKEAREELYKKDTEELINQLEKQTKTNEGKL